MGSEMCIRDRADSVSAAQVNAYERVGTISWKGEYHRNDIGHRAIARESA